MIYRYAKTKGYAADKTGGLGSYSDQASVSTWAKDAVSWCVGTGIIRGRDNGGGRTLSPQDTVQRCEVAAILERLVKVAVQ